jgi:hypothetical protein
MTSARSRKRDEGLRSPARSMALSTVRRARPIRPTRSHVLSLLSLPDGVGRWGVYKEGILGVRTCEVRDVLDICPETYGTNYGPHLVDSIGAFFLEGCIEVDHLLVVSSMSKGSLLSGLTA